MPGFLPMATLGALELRAEWKKWLVASYAAVPTDSVDLDKLARNLLPWAQPLLEPRRYKCLWGGRGSGKSTAAADALLIEGARRKCRVLCAREFQVSIKDSVHHLLKQRIEDLGLESVYSVQEAQILGPRGTQFIFKGLRHNISSIKSISGITHCWVEEAQTISQKSWNDLVPSIRAPGSEIWVTFNPYQKTDPIYQTFLINPGQLGGGSYIQRVNWDLNPYFPPELDAERQAMQATDPDLYEHIWEGECLENADSQVLYGKWIVDEFKPAADWQGPYFGADWGFAADPTAAVKCWIHGNRLYIEQESYAHRLELDETAKRWIRDIPGIDGHVVRVDNSRPESISHVSRRGIPRLTAVRKWPGSVEDGIAYLRNFEKVVIHPRCSNMATEARLYSYKVDKLSGDILPQVIDANNHLMDALRYALGPMIQQRQTGMAQSVAVWG
jgi:phage terminase large subunit